MNDKKVPCIPPIFHYNKFVTDFSKKPNLFNSFFAKQCSIIENSIVFNSSTIPVTNQYLANIEFTQYDIKRIIYQLDPNKAHGHDMITIRMLKMFGNAIIEPLFQKFKNCLKFLKKATNKTSKTLAQSLFVQSVVRFSNVSKTVTC